MEQAVTAGEPLSETLIKALHSYVIGARVKGVNLRQAPFPCAGQYRNAGVLSSTTSAQQPHHSEIPALMADFVARYSLPERTSAKDLDRLYEELCIMQPFVEGVRSIASLLVNFQRMRVGLMPQVALCGVGFESLIG